MTLPIDRSPLALAAGNQVPYQVAASTKNINAMTNAYNTIDELNDKVNAHAASVLLPHADGSVSTAKIAPLSVTNEKIANGVITADKFAPGALTNDTQNALRITALRAETVTGYLNIMSAPYSASGSNATTTGSISSGSNTLSLTAPIDFVNGQGINITGIKEVANLVLSAPATSSGNVTVTLNGIDTVIAILSGDTAIQVATKIRAATHQQYSGWSAGGSGATIVYTCSTTGNKTDAVYSAGTTGATGTMTTTTQGTADFITTIVSGAGTTSLTLAGTATTTVSGVTVQHDDTASFQLAGLSGQSVFIPKGTFWITGNIFLNVNTCFIGLSKTDSIIKIGADVDIFYCTRQNIIEKIGIDGSSYSPYTKNVIELSSRTMDMLGEITAKGNSYLKVNEIRAQLNNPWTPSAYGSFLNLWAATTKDSVTYKNTQIYHVHVSNIEIAGIGTFCKNYYYLAAPGDLAYLAMLKFEYITINALVYGWFGSENESTMLDGKYKEAANVTIDNTLFQCGNLTSKRFAVFTAGGYMITNSVAMDWGTAFAGLKPYALLYRANLSDQGYKIFFDENYGTPTQLIELLNPPVGYTTQQTSDYIDQMFLPFRDITRDSIYTYDQKFMTKSGLLSSAGGGTYPQYYKIAEFDSNNQYATTDFFFSFGYNKPAYGTVNFQVKKNDATPTDPTATQILEIVTNPSIPESAFGEFYITKDVIGGVAHYNIYLKLLSSTLGLGGYYFSRTLPHLGNASTFDMTVTSMGTTAPSGTLIKGTYRCTPVNLALSIASGATTKAISGLTEYDGNYYVNVSPAWNTTWWITGKTNGGFTINFGTAPGSTSSLDWFVRR